jgi:hypothetical protein
MSGRSANIWSIWRRPNETPLLESALFDELLLVDSSLQEATNVQHANAHNHAALDRN